LRRLRELHDGGILPNLRILGIVANMVSAGDSPKSREEEKVLLEAEGLARDAWGSPVVLFESRIRESSFYPSTQRDVEKKLRLPSLVSERITKEYESLANEIEKRIHEDLGTA
jgi:hypothetical protein